MNLQTLLQDLNPGKFVVYISLLIFVSLLSLRLDDVLQTSYWAIFTPLWLWKFLVLLGALTGSCAWWKRPNRRVDLESYVHFKAMLLSLSLHLLLLLFEVLACDKLESGRHLWILVFLPLFSLSVICIAVCIWALKHERPFELELFGAVNLLQFIFIALRLDSFILWKWELVFIPLWITLCLALIGVLYAVILAAFLLRSPNTNIDQRRASAHTALGYASLVIPGLVSQVLLTNKLDGEIDLPYSVICIPFLISMTTLVLRAFTARGGNLWWFGMQKDFCLFLLDLFPSLREYGNISYRPSHIERQLNRNVVPEAANLSPNSFSIKSKHKNQPTKFEIRTVVPIIAIDIPD
nr:EOG090X087A [Cyclestheria hislopi]